MNRLFVFTEEPSAKEMFDVLLPKILPEDISFQVYQHQGKQDLEKALKGAVPSIGKIPGARILITIDQDSNDCKVLKNRLNDIVKANCAAPYKIRIVCKELEAWFLGDLSAISSAYPRFKPEFYRDKANFRNVDTIRNPNKLLLGIIPEFADRNYLPKVQVAQQISPHLNPDENTSESFKQTIAGLMQLVEA